MKTERCTFTRKIWDRKAFKEKKMIKKQRKKRLLPLFGLCLTAAAILAVPGLKAHAGENTVRYEIYVAGVQVTSDNAGNVLAGTDNDGKVQYDPDTNTLTLDGADIAFASTYWYCPLEIKQEDLTIQMLNQNVIRESTVGKRTSTTHTVYSKGNLTFCGEGSLEIQGVAACSKDLYALMCEGDLALQSGTLKATVGDCTSVSKKNIRNNQAVVAVGNIRITGGELTAVSGKASENGLSSAVFTTKDIEISDAVVSATSGAGVCSYAINTNTTLTISNSTVTCTGGEATDYSTGLHCECEVDGNLTGTLRVCNSTITAASQKAGKRSIAICATELWADNSAITAGFDAEGGNSSGTVDGVHINRKAVLNNCREIRAQAGTAEGSGSLSIGWWCSQLEVNDSSVAAQGGSASAESYGLIAADSFKLHGGSVRAQGGAASDWSVGLWTPEAGISISAGTLAAIAGQANGTNAITGGPIFTDGYKAVVKAGTEEADAVVIEAPSDETYKSNTYVSIEPYVHIHAWAEDWTSDDMHHWHACMEDDCGITEYTQMDAYGEHKFDDAYDADCNVCGAKRTVPARPAAPSYQITDGADGRWIMQADGSLSIRGNGDFDRFQEVRVDGRTLAPEHYEVSAGSTVVTLKAVYLNTLAAGSHSLEIVWTDGSAGTTFTVEEKNSGSTDHTVADNNAAAGENTGINPANTVPDGVGTKDNEPKTGDSISVEGVLAILAVSGGVMILIGVRRKVFARQRR